MGIDKWDVLRTAKPLLRDTFAALGVERVEYVVGFDEPYEVSVWLGTATDAQRNSLAEFDGLREQVSALLQEAGIEPSDARFDGVVVVQSQETVDRDYKGSWFYALR